MDVFFEGLNISFSTFCVCADGFQGLSKDISIPFHYGTNHKLFFVSLKLLTHFENAY
jgi:hypothetical protein